MEYQPPATRRLRAYVLDPSLSSTLETAVISETVMSVPWEDLRPGPVGEYLEVVDYDPMSGMFYAPVNLQDPHLIAQDGLTPSESDPCSHQQMVYAVASTTIQHFEKALGRKIFWAARREEEDNPDHGYVARLRIYPHALRGANAYYSPDRKALLFGYFDADASDGIHAPGSTVFTCLSHDVVAHETTHALLDGLHRRYIEPTHPDALAFHEAFADIVALFQHFTYPEVLKSQIKLGRGDMGKATLMAGLAREFGKALGKQEALRNYLAMPADPAALEGATEPHERGAILVAAIYDAFATIYTERAKKTIRLATNGSGVLPDGDLPAILVEALANEAAKTAKHFLDMCIRALDYCPPVTITFGDYLRALITSDLDMVSEDDYGYRIALVDAFRKRGIFASGVTFLSEDQLVWPSGRAFGFNDTDNDWLGKRLREQVNNLQFEDKRKELFLKLRRARIGLHDLLVKERDQGFNDFGQLCGIDLHGSLPDIVKGHDGLPKFEVHQLRTAFRARPDGTLLNHVVLVVTQQRRVPIPGTEEHLVFRGGATLIIDLDSMAVRYCIRRPIDDQHRLDAYLEYIAGLTNETRMRFFPKGEEAQEPFAFLHAEN